MQEGEIIVSGSDISPYLNAKDIDFLNQVDTVIERSIAQSDPTYAFNFGRSLWKDGHLKGLALSKFLAKLSQQWVMFQNGSVNERFEDAVNAEIGISPQTVRKYSSMWENVFENDNIPDSVKSQLYGKPIKSLLLLNAAARDDDGLDWYEVGNASTGNEIRDLVRAARGEQTSSKNAIRIVLTRDGTLKVYRGGGSQEYVIIGNLDLSLLGDPDVKKAVSRLVDRGGVIWA